jgi:aryl-alcohol dehydrogenase-like predicted oxidoreductase
MEKRRLGRTGHESSVVIFGAAALGNVPPAEAEAALDLARSFGVNHIDVAPSYGQAEERIGPWLAKHRAELYVGCKTLERTRQGAWEELHRSLARLQVDRFDLYQLHAIKTMEDLDTVLGPGGAIEALVEARDRGLISAIGITGHGIDAPSVHAAALTRFDFDTVMTPINFVQWADPRFRADAERLLTLAAEKNVGVMAIKAICKAPWGERPQRYETWYEPFDDPREIERSIRFVLSQPITAFTSAGDIRLLRMIFAAAESFRPMTSAEQQALVETAGSFQPLFAPK